MTDSSQSSSPLAAFNIQDTPEKAAEYLRMALPLMRQFGVPTTPINFTIWYEYASGRNGELNEYLDSVASEKQSLSNHDCSRIFQRFILGPGAEELAEATAHLKHLMDDTVENITHASKEANRCTDKFSEHTRQLDAGGDVNQMRDVLADVVAEARHLAETGRELQDRLESTNNEVDALREELNRVKHAASTDALTGLLNRGAFDNTLTECIAEATVEISPLCLLMVDIDHFKQVNDKYGHLLGDKVLRFLGSQLKQHVGEQGHAARYGGEEFAIILPGLTIEKAFELGESIRSGMEASRLKRKESEESLGRITISVGAAQFRKGETLEDFMRRADSSLYCAKENGRNRVVSETQLEEAPARSAG